MKSNNVIILGLIVAIGVAFAGVFALEHNHHGKGKAVRIRGKNNVVGIESFVLPPGEKSLGETTPKIILTPAKSLSSPSP
jgi:hypothetical protein